MMASSLVALLVSLSGLARAAPTPWWESWGQPELGALVREGLAHNPDLAALDALQRQQQALAAQAMAGFLPALSFDVKGQLSPYDSLGFGFGLPSMGTGPEVYGAGSAMLGLSLGVDLWGRQVQGWRASRLEATAAEGDEQARALVLAGAITAAWLDQATASRQLQLVDEQLRVSGELLEIVERRYQAGAASALDLLQQRQQQAALQAQRPLVEASLRTAGLRLATLLGRPLDQAPPPAAALPSAGPAPAIEAADLPQDRPDLRAAAERAQAAGVRAQAAVRALLPSLGLSGSAGWQATWIEDWSQQDTWTVGGQLSVPLFGGGATHAGIRAARAAHEVREQQLLSATRAALQEVEQARVLDEQQARRRQAAATQREAAEAAWEVARTAYAAGTADYLQVQTTLASLLSARLGELQADRDALGARLSLHQALGGTWPPSSPVGTAP